MKIHTKRHGENLSQIAEEYATDEEIIKKVNELDFTEPADGEELLIVQPTRTYRVQFGDTPEGIALRFGIRKEELLLSNPDIIGRQLVPGESIILKTGERPLGMAVSNGYLFDGCSAEKLMRALPFLTYVTFCSAVADRSKIRSTFNDRETVEKVTKLKKIPLIRIYDKHTERYESEKELTPFAEQMIAYALDGGYKGIVLDTCSISISASDFSAFLMILRKLMIGCDLILITEINENSPSEYSEYADGSVIFYPKYVCSPNTSFEEGERKLLSDFACNGESAKTFIDLPSLALCKGGYMNISDALKLARGRECEITKNESTLLSHFNDKKQGEIRFPSMENLKRIFDLIAEFDYMGICFDIMRVPTYQLMMYNSLFKTSYMNGVRTREGCSRGVEE